MGGPCFLSLQSNTSWICWGTGYDGTESLFTPRGIRANTSIPLTVIFIAPSKGTTLSSAPEDEAALGGHFFPHVFLLFFFVPICLPKAGAGPHTWDEDNEFLG